MISTQNRQLIIECVLNAMTQGARQVAACKIIGICSRTFQNWQSKGLVDKRTMVKKTPGNKLNTIEKETILKICNSEKYKNFAPKQIVPMLADEDIYIASERSFYRVLKAEQQLTHRCRSKSPRPISKPSEQVATGKNQVYSWDITYLNSTVKGRFFYLYLFMDIFSRKIVGWEIFEKESSEYAADVLRKIYIKEGLSISHKVVLHSDNGSPMKGATMLATLQGLGMIPSFSRPSVSNDNPYSEALFKTLKYAPAYPSKPFDSINLAREWMNDFVDWYNNHHHHSAIKFVTPNERHEGLDHQILKNREQVYNAAKARNPNRWTTKIRDWSRAMTVILNPNKLTELKI